MYIGVKEFISQYKVPFNRADKATKKAKAALKERGETATKKAIEEEKLIVIAEWDKKTQDGIKAHNTIHKREMKKHPTSVYTEYKKRNKEDIGELDAQLESNLKRELIYFEKKIVSNHHHILGYADRVEVTKDGYINIEDYKTWNQVYRKSTFTVSSGFTIQPTYFFAPVNHLQDCNYNEACLQLSLYMYILWTYNKTLKPGKLTIRHVKLSEDGENIINETLIDVPYMREEIKALLRNKKVNE